MSPRHILLATLLLPAALALVGCGNKGELLRPGEAAHVPAMAPAPAATSAVPSRPAVAATAAARG